MLDFITNMNLTLTIIAILTNCAMYVINFYTPAEIKKDKNKKDMIKINNQLYILNFIFPGIKETIYAFIEWGETNPVKVKLLINLLCFIPIFNILIICSNLNEILERG